MPPLPSPIDGNPASLDYALLRYSVAYTAMHGWIGNQASIDLGAFLGGWFLAASGLDLPPMAAGFPGRRSWTLGHSEGASALVLWRRDHRSPHLVLDTEHGEGTPVAGWSARLRGATVRWVRFDERPGRVLDAMARLSDGQGPGEEARIEWHWWDRDVDALGEVTRTHAEGAAHTALGAIEAAEAWLVAPDDKTNAQR